MQDNRFLTIRETSELLKMGRTKIYQYINKNELKSVKFGKSRRISTKSIEEFVRKYDSCSSEN